METLCPLALNFVLVGVSLITFSHTLAMPLPPPLGLCW